MVRHAILNGMAIAAALLRALRRSQQRRT